jgi:hypothetical protein
MVTDPTHPSRRSEMHGIITLIVAGLLLSAAPAAAQQLEIGVRGGLARSNEVTSQIEICFHPAPGECGPASTHPHHWRQAPTYGVVLRQQATRRTALRGELNLVHRGHGPGEMSASHVASRYLEAPLLLELRLARTGALELQLAGGVAPAVMLACRYTGLDVNGPVDAPCDEISPWSGESYGPTVDYDLGALLAPGVRLHTGGGSLGLEFRYSRGLVDVRPEAHGRTTNLSFVTAVAYTHRLGAGR